MPEETTGTEERTQSDRADRPATLSERDLRWRQFQSRSPRLRMFLIIAVVVLVVTGFFLWRYFNSYESTDDAQIDGHLNPVSARVGGHVERLLVKDNQYVKAGQPLVEIDARDYQVLVARAQADYDNALAEAKAAGVNVPITSTSTTSQLAAAAAEVAAARAALAGAQQQYEAANAQLAQADANNVKAQNDLARYKQLVSKQEISQQQYDQAYAAAQGGSAAVDASRAAAAAAQQQIKAARSRVTEAEANMRAARTGPQQVKAMRSRVQSAQALVEGKKAALDQAKLNLQYTTIVSPVEGVVTNRTVEAGQNVQPGQELMRVINLDDIWVTANFKETQLRDMRANQPVTIHVDTTGREYKGHLDSIAAASGSITSLLPPENATGNFVKIVQRIPVKITFDRGETREHVLRPGMSVEPKVWIR
ncbi:MAG: HlyD family secretion protein [Acidobacteria bacterium]|nr:HlyD family secretion protein [Acidobacteriota bacterium]MBV9623016.1 HlyD family secretion protein [Acidobacteriota bacterium]